MLLINYVKKRVNYKTNEHLSPGMFCNICSTATCMLLQRNIPQYLWKILYLQYACT